MNDTEQQIVAHDAKRCPECNELGKLEEFRTRSDEHAGHRTAGTDNSREWDRVQSRIYECRGEDCETRWESYA